MKQRVKIMFAVISVLCLVLFVADVCVGSVTLSPGQVWRVLSGRGTSGDMPSMILNMRFVKAVVAVVAGAALSSSGLQMQTLFRNPLAGPYVLGVSAGAMLGVALVTLGGSIAAYNIPAFVTSIGSTGAAWLGSALILVIIFAVSRRIKDIMVILILGMMLSSGIGSLVEILQYLSRDSALKSFVVWSMGSFSNVTSAQLMLIVPITLVGIAMSVAIIKPLNLILLGENYARSMGVNIDRTRNVVVASTTLLAGTITAFCGPIGFVGIAAPHLARMIFSTADHRVIMPGAMAVGVAVMLVSDIVSKLFTLPVNTITALLGIPIVIYVVLRNKNMR